MKKIIEAIDKTFEARGSYTPSANAVPPPHPLRPIRPLMGDKAPRWTDETETKCGCDFCQHWSPLIDHISAQLDEEGNKLLNELVEDWMIQEEDRVVAEAKLAGDWPGYEELKNFKPKS